MRDFFYSFKISSLFVGTVIGAGFATGEEIRNYFWGSGIVCVLISAFMFALMSAVFMFLGKNKKIRINSKIKPTISVVKVIAVLISFMAMSAGAEEVVERVFFIRGGGVITAIISYLLLCGKVDKIGVLNAIIVPIIAIFILTISIKSDFIEYSGLGFSLWSAFSYATMNIFTAGMMAEKYGKEMSNKQIIISTILNFVFVGLLMTVIKVTVGNSVGSMPMVSVAKNSGIWIIAEIVVYLAIVTTMLGNLSVILLDVRSLLKFEPLVLCFIILAATFSKLAGFSEVVKVGYPIIGVCGAIYLIYAVASLIVARRNFLFDKCHDGVHSAG